MKNINETGLKLCVIQGNIFEQSIKLDCSSAVFIRRFMYSNLAKHLDEGDFLSESYNTNLNMNEFSEKYNSTKSGNKKYSKEELYWIGYIYRYFCYTHEKSSKYIFKIINSKELRKLYYPYHSLDPKQALDRILEAKNIKEIDLISKGIELYRKLINS